MKNSTTLAMIGFFLLSLSAVPVRAHDGVDAHPGAKGLAKHQRAEKHRLGHHQRRERRIATNNDLNRHRLSHHQAKERKRLQKHQQRERRVFRARRAAHQR